LNDADFAILNRFSLNFKAQMAQLDGESAAYMGAISAKGAAPEPAKLEEFRARQLATATQGMKSLKAQLSPAGASALFRFIDGDFRASVRRVPIGGK
jgi:hypothetical protein